MKKTTLVQRVLVLSAGSIVVQHVSSYTIQPKQNHQVIPNANNQYHQRKQYGQQKSYIKSIRSSKRCMLSHDNANTLWTAVEFFDGSTIIDPVVVSNVFWSRLQANILSVILGQFLAAIVFSFLLSLAASQVTKILNYISELVTTTTTTGTSTFETPNLRIPRNLRDDNRTDTTLIRPDFGKLIACLAIDAIGSSSILIPFIGDATDVLWAPTAGLLLRYLFNNSNILFILEFTEEILPLTDILPLATLCWLIDTFFRTSNLAKLLQLGEYATLTERDRLDAIDIDVKDFMSKADTKKNVDK
jgi:hypothetical protein